MSNKDKNPVLPSLSLGNNPVGWLFLFALALTLILWLINISFFHYYVGNYHHNLTTFFYLLVSANAAVLAAAKYLENDLPKIALILGSIPQMFLLLALISFMWPVLMTTPFPLQDNFFYHIDAALHFNIGDIYLWSKQHSLVNTSMTYMGSMDVALIVAPLLLAIFTDKKTVRVYFTMLLISFLAGGMLYYFFPSTDPAHAVTSIHFPDIQYVVIDRFQTIHHHAIFTDYRTGGIASFPSFHNVWAFTFIYCFRKANKPLFLLAIIYSLLISLSTILTGWHFLSDIIAGVLLAGLSAILAEKLCAKIASLDNLAATE